MLIAAMSVVLDEQSRRKEQFGLTCKEGNTAIDMAGVFDLAPPELSRLRNGKRVAPDNYYPTFIWFPDGAPYRQAQQLCPEEFSGIDGHVVLRSVTMEAAPDAPVLKRLEIQAPWLDEIRKDQVSGSYEKHGIYQPRRHSQIETDNARP